MFSLQKTGSSTNKVASFYASFPFPTGSLLPQILLLPKPFQTFLLVRAPTDQLLEILWAEESPVSQEKKPKPWCSCKRGQKTGFDYLSQENNEEKLWRTILGSLHPGSDFPASLLSRPRSPGLGMERLQAWHSYDVSWRPPQDREPKALDVAYSGPLSKLAHGNGASRNVHD